MATQPNVTASNDSSSPILGRAMVTEAPMKGKRKEAIVVTRSTTPLLVSLLARFFISAIVAHLTSQSRKPRYHNKPQCYHNILPVWNMITGLITNCACHCEPQSAEAISRDCHAACRAGACPERDSSVAVLPRNDKKRRGSQLRLTAMTIRVAKQAPTQNLQRASL